MIDQLGQRQAGGVAAQLLDQAHEDRERAAGLAGQMRHGGVETGVVRARGVLQHLERARADAAGGKVHHAQERGVVVRVGDQAQVGERVLDLLALEEAQPAIHAVGNAGREELRARARATARWSGRAARSRCAARRRAPAPGSPRRSSAPRRRPHRPRRHGSARPRLVGPQVLAEAVAVVKDDRVGGVEDVAVRAVVLLQADHVAHPELALEVAHVADLGAAEAVDALVVVADAEHRRAALAALVGEELQPAVLQAVGVLELVDQDVAEAALVVAAQRLVALEQFVAAQQQLRKIHNRLALALRLILLVELHAQAGVVVPGLDRVRAVAGFLLAVDEMLELARRELLVVDVQGLQQALDRGELVSRVEDLEELRQPGVAVVGAQQAVGTGRGRCRSTCRGCSPAASRRGGRAFPWPPCW
jgi:hypothetical protein